MAFIVLYNRVMGKLPGIRCVFIHGLSVLGLILVLIVSTAGGGRAEQSLEIPAPQGQRTIHVRPRPSPAPQVVPPSNRVQTIPAAPTQSPPPPAPAQVEPVPQNTAPPPVAQPREPVLPPVFRGCWRGRVDEVDRIQRLPGAKPIGPWMPKTYVLCYRRVGYGPFKLTFTEAGVEGGGITNTTGDVQLVSTDGRNYATMRAVLRFDEYLKRRTAFGPSTFAVEEVTDLQCDIERGGLNVSGSVLGRRNGVPWFRAWWHATFVHVPNVPE
jgi:hypothetical protein